MVRMLTLSRLTGSCLLALTLGLLARGQEAPAPAPGPAAEATGEQLRDYTIPEISLIDRPYIPIRIFGSLAQVNAGRVSPWVPQLVDPTGYLGALGFGTPGRDQAMGELLTIAGRTFIRATDPKTGIKIVEMPGAVRSPFLLGISFGNHPVIFPRPVHVSEPAPKLLHTLLEEVARDADNAIAVLGWLDMPEAVGMALKKAPLYDDALFGDKRATYLDTIQVPNAHVMFFAIVAPAPSTLKRPSLNAALLKDVAFDGPRAADADAALIHIHAAIVNEAAPKSFVTTPTILTGMHRATVKEILHLHGASTVSNGSLIVFRADMLAK
jgi:hypothetical protein